MAVIQTPSTLADVWYQERPLLWLITINCSLPSDSNFSVCPDIPISTYLPNSNYSFVDGSFDTVQYVTSAGTYYGLYSPEMGCTDTIVYALTVFDCDWDNDGIIDTEDPDDDNDGILDVIQACGDTATTFICFGGDPAGDIDNDGTLNLKTATSVHLIATTCVPF